MSASEIPRFTQRPGPGLRIGLIVPCRNEEAVIGRKLENLARLAWPRLEPVPGRIPAHRLIVVDDGSQDRTAERAAEALARCFPAQGRVHAELLASTLSPGKSGALTSAIGRLGDGVDLVLVSDADVIFEDDALERIAEAFEADERLGMACGAQRFVRALADDGSLSGPDGGAPVRADDFYDRWSSRVRAFESRFGKLFSVHGQLLAWRAALGLVPGAGLAADDLDLMFQVRARGRRGEEPSPARVARIATARFLEVKLARGGGAQRQGLRRARAYFQVLAGRRAPLGRGLFDRVQWAFYAWVPRWLPEAVLAASILAVVAALQSGGVALLWVLVPAVVALSTRSGRRALELLLLIRRARRSLRDDGERQPSGVAWDHWETQRT